MAYAAAYVLLAPSVLESVHRLEWPGVHSMPDVVAHGTLKIHLVGNIVAMYPRNSPQVGVENLRVPDRE